MEIEESKNKQEEESSEDEVIVIPHATFSFKKGDPVVNKATVFCLPGISQAYGLMGLDELQPIDQIFIKNGENTKVFAQIYETKECLWVICSENFPKRVTHNFQTIFEHVSKCPIFILHNETINSLDSPFLEEEGFYYLRTSHATSLEHLKLLPEGVQIFDFAAYLIGLAEKAKQTGYIFLSIQRDYGMNSESVCSFSLLAKSFPDIFPKIEKTKKLSLLVSSLIKKQSSYHLYI